MRRVFLFAIAAILLYVHPAWAQGPYLGVGFVYNNPVGSDIGYLDGGPGLDFTFGYDFGPVALEGNLLESRHGDSDPGYSHADFYAVSMDLRIFFLPPAQPNQVYFLVGFGSYSLDEYDPYLGVDTELQGYGWNVGAGLEHFFTQNVALNAAVIYRFIRYDEFYAGGFGYSISPDLDGDTVTFKGGLMFYW